MAIYRFKVSFDDFETVYRVIDIKSNQTFEDLHHAILKSIDFKEGEFASFYIDYEGDDECIEICLSDLQSETIDHGLLMKEVKIGEIITKNLIKLTYIYDFTELWIFKITPLEKQEIETTNLNYPVVVKSVGQPPLQGESNLLISADLSKDDTNLINQLKQRNKEMLLKHELEEEFYGEDIDEDDLIEDDENY